MLNLVRDPRAVSSSWERRFDRDTAVRQTNDWVQRQLRLFQWSTSLGDRFALVRYEDFTARPKSTVQQILGWAGFDARVENFVSDDRATVSWDRQHLFAPANESVLAEKRTGLQDRRSERVARRRWIGPAPARRGHHPAADESARLSDRGARMRTSFTWNTAARISQAAAFDFAAPALSVAGETWSYRDLLGAASWLAGQLQEPTHEVDRPITAVMADRVGSSYVGILACILKGHGYVPINVAHPIARNVQVLRRSGARELICGRKSAPYLRELVHAEPQLREQLAIIPSGDARDEMPVVLGAAYADEPAPRDAPCYVLFTSGSTGEPKGVTITHGNLTGYLDAVDQVMDVGPQDRFSQTFELSFDVSVHDLMVCWTHGAHLIVPDAAALAAPGDYIRDRAITCWFSVPTLAFQAQLQGSLTPGAFPSLRWSLFVGEALPLALAHAWEDAASNGRTENWYGPTEATIACALPDDGAD